MRVIHIKPEVFTSVTYALKSIIDGMTEGSIKVVANTERYGETQYLLDYLKNILVVADKELEQ